MSLMKEKLILALDFPDRNSCLDFLNPIRNEIKWVKIGMELFYKEGAPLVNEISEMGFSIFLDLKLHDIPNTVGAATKSLLGLPIQMLNFHIAGGSEMLSQAVKQAKSNTMMIGVTQLTSTSDERLKKEIGIDRSMKDTVLLYTGVAKESKLDGVVCSPQDLKEIKNAYPDMTTVCPGIRRTQDAKGDQVRITTPKDAIRMGADFLVMGRSITLSENPKQTIGEIYKEMEEGLV